MNDNKAKQQIVDKIKSSSNILVTVSTNPSVDELSAALGLTVLLNKMEKHATAVFSGSIPPAITFLDPQKTFENTVNSLRDFIIALDKEKADHLRYKVDGDVVKIFITPYRTTISSDDLEFSQGDYNVELVLALGVSTQDNLDAALSAHGRILHDATVVTMEARGEKSELGSIDWNEPEASSLSEMLVGLSDSLKKGDKALLDEQIATAFMTGIVAATDRFSNDLTSSRSMTVAAQLMAAGANQQLIAAELEQANEIGSGAQKASVTDGSTALSEGQSTKLVKEQPAAKKEDDGSLTISHEKRGDLEAVRRETEAEHQKEAQREAEKELQEVTTPQARPDAAQQAEQKLADQLAAVAPAAAAKPSVADLRKDLAEASNELNDAAQGAPSTVGDATIHDAWKEADQPPMMGGTLNATTEQAASDARKAEQEDRNKTILSHGTRYVGDQSPAFQSPINAAAQPEQDQQGVDVFKEVPRPAFDEPREEKTRAQTIEPPMPTIPEPQFEATPVPAPMAPPPLPPLPEPTSAEDSAGPTLEDIEKQNNVHHEDATAQEGSEHDEARAAVHEALNAAPPPLPPMPELATPSGAVDFTPSTPVPASATPEAPQLAPNGLPPLPPLPDFSTLPPMPGDQPAATLPPDEKLGDMLAPAPTLPPTPVVTDPKQYKIPGQG